MTEAVFSNSKTYNNISERRSIGFEYIEKALDMVKDFIIRKKRIVYGGMCLDLALKMSGHPGIYSENTLPDYDFLTPDFYNESNELADILHKAGLPNVSAINAAHFSSRRVRVNFVSVADLSYVPINIYEKLPTLVVSKTIKDYAGLTILHPNFQRNDMHRAFNGPFANPPMEVVLHRLEKDQKRFRLIDAQYPISINQTILKRNSIEHFENEKNKKSCHKLVLKKMYAQNGVIGGLMAYAILLKFIGLLISPKSTIYGKLEEVGVLDYCYEKLMEIIYVNVDFEDDEIIAYMIDKDINYVNIWTDDFPTLLSKFDSEDKITYKNKFLDNLRPRTIEVQHGDSIYEIFDSKGDLLPCYTLQKVIDMLKENIGGDFKDLTGNFENIYITQPNTILLYFSQKSFELDKHEQLYRSLYKSTLNLVEIAEKIYLALLEVQPELMKKIYKYFPFYLSVHTYGKYNWSTDYISSIKDKKAMLDMIDPNKETNKSIRPPFGFYPSRGEHWIPFNPADSELFQIDGLTRYMFDPVSI